MPLPMPLLGFLLGIGSGVVGAVGTVGSMLARGLQFLFTGLLKFLQWCAMHPEAAATVGAILWILAS